ncbi:MAG: RNA-binding S4 domain-containing protein [Undibacterium sp.]|nr:RNA-binding S4 domain-containing protein [Undibacterium sp.]
MRIDKWLWAARFFKTRSLACQAVDLGRILQNEQRVKPAHMVKIGDLIAIQQGELVWQIHVARLLETRGSATVAQTMYIETPESLSKRQQQAENRRFQTEPAAHLRERPTKRQRRLLNALTSE